MGNTPGHRDLTENEITDIKALKEAEKDYIRHLETVGSHYAQGKGPGRELALAKTKVQEATMWAVKGITEAGA